MRALSKMIDFVNPVFPAGLSRRRKGGVAPPVIIEDGVFVKDAIAA